MKALKSAALILLLVAPAYAENEAEKAARLKAAEMQRALDQSLQEQSRLAEEMKKLRVTIAAGAASGNAAEKAARLRMVELQQALDQAKLDRDKLAEEMRKVQQKAVDSKQELDRGMARDVAESSASQADDSRNILYTVIASVITAILALVGQVWKNYHDSRKEERDHKWKLEAEAMLKETANTGKKTHDLVNSGATSNLKRERVRLKSNLVQLKVNLALIKKTDDQSLAPSIIAEIAATEEELIALTKDIEERERIAAA